jgi:hypothetical protein
MQNTAIALFENSGLIAKGKPVLRNIRKMKMKQIVDLLNQFAEITSYSKINTQPSIFSHVASASLSGGKEIGLCLRSDETKRRIDKVNKLAQFAAFYSDKVYINNPFLETILNVDGGREESAVQEYFTQDITVFAELLPLLSAGRVESVYFDDMCPHCYFEKSLKMDGKIYTQALSGLKARYERELKFALGRMGDKFFFAAKGSEKLLPPNAYKASPCQ